MAKQSKTRPADPHRPKVTCATGEGVIPLTRTPEARRAKGLRMFTGSELLAGGVFLGAARGCGLRLAAG